ncbi:hypothetical protein C0993_010630 [Termitomyces sp. T159_Od127]|nr:hypothetical protein C0993_010630 [Termitomyces sp. T159_Od127]
MYFSVGTAQPELQPFSTVPAADFPIDEPTIKPFYTIDLRATKVAITPEHLAGSAAALVQQARRLNPAPSAFTLLYDFVSQKMTIRIPALYWFDHYLADSRLKRLPPTGCNIGVHPELTCTHPIDTSAGFSPCGFVIHSDFVIHGAHHDPRITIFVRNDKELTPDILFAPTPMGFTVQPDGPERFVPLQSAAAFTGHVDNDLFSSTKECWEVALTFFHKFGVVDGITTIQSCIFNFDGWETAMPQDSRKTTCHAHAHITFTPTGQQALLTYECFAQTLRGREAPPTNWEPIEAIRLDNERLTALRVNDLSKKVTKIQEDMDEGFKAINKQIEGFNGRFTQIEGKINQGFEQIKEKINEEFKPFKALITTNQENPPTQISKKDSNAELKHDREDDPEIDTKRRKTESQIG